MRRSTYFFRFTLCVYVALDAACLDAACFFLSVRSLGLYPAPVASLALDLPPLTFTSLHNAHSITWVGGVTA